MKNKKTKRLILLLAVIMIVVLVPILSYHMYCHYSVRAYYQLLADNADDEAVLAQIEKMPDVNMLPNCSPIYYLVVLRMDDLGYRGYPLDSAILFKRDAQIIEALLKKGADPNKAYLMLRNNPFEEAVSWNYTDANQQFEIIKLMVSYGADPKSVSAASVNGLWIWNECEDKELQDNLRKTEYGIMIYLLENGASLWGKNYTKQSVLHMASAGMTLEELEEFCGKEYIPMDELINGTSQFGETPLHYAARYNKYNNCKFLLEQGADIGIKNDKGQTAYDIAVEKGYEDIADLIKKFEK